MVLQSLMVASGPTGRPQGGKARQFFEQSKVSEQLVSAPELFGWIELLADPPEEQFTAQPTSISRLSVKLKLPVRVQSKSESLQPAPL